MAERRCMDTGYWEGRTLRESSTAGWTNYTPCFIPEMWDLIKKLYATTEEDAKVSYVQLLKSTF